MFDINNQGLEILIVKKYVLYKSNIYNLHYMNLNL